MGLEILKLLQKKLSSYNMFSSSRFFLITIGLFLAFSLQAQKKDVVQFSGLVVTGDSLQAVPFATVYIANKKIGTSTDHFGYFSFAAQVGDSIQFSSVGYSSALFVIPDTISDKKYSVIQTLSTDTVFLTETVIYPWPSREQFREAFLALRVPTDDYERAMKNLNPDDIYARMQEMPAAGSETFKHIVQRDSEKMYYAGQAPPVQLLNPFAWAKFVKAWQNGDFKRKETKDD
jgi:hypothetical protein